MRRRYVIGLVAVVAVLSTGASDCGGGEESNDSKRIANDTTGVVTLAFPDGYSNAAAKCFGTDMVYTTPNDNGRALGISPGHPWCEDGVLTTEEMRR